MAIAASSLPSKLAPKKKFVSTPAKAKPAALKPRLQAREQEPLPEAPEIEKAVLGAIFDNAEVGFPTFERIGRKGFFANQVNREVYDRAKKFYQENGRLDLIGFTADLGDAGRLASLGGPHYVTELFTQNLGSDLLEYYVDQLREKYLRRQIITRSFALAGRAKSEDLSELLADMARSVEDLKRASGGPNGSEQFDFDQLMAFDSTHDPNTLVGNRYLVRGASSLWCAGSGYGKSTLAIQLAVYWACGQRCFGLRPVRPLKSLIIEAENDRGDMAEQLQGVIMGVSRLGEIDVQGCHDKIRSNIGIHRAVGKTGFEFLGLLDTLVQIDKPDFVWIDPLFAFSGCDLLNPEKTGNFLRNGLFPLASKRNVALNVIHHIGKPVRDPSKDDHSAMAEIDYQYLGFGTSEIQNSFRAVNILLPVGNSGVFKLVFSKRGERAGSADDAGNWTRSVFLQHSKEGLCWIEAEKPERRAAPGSIKYTVDDILNEMSATLGKSTEEQREHMKTECGMSPRTFYRLWKDMKKDEKIRVDSEGKWYRKAGSLP